MAINGVLLNILDWFDKSKYEYSYWVIDCARKKNHTEVIEWFEKSKYRAQI